MLPSIPHSFSHFRTYDIGELRNIKTPKEVSNGPPSTFDVVPGTSSKPTCFHSCHTLLNPVTRRKSLRTSTLKQVLLHCFLSGPCGLGPPTLQLLAVPNSLCAPPPILLPLLLLPLLFVAQQLYFFPGTIPVAFSSNCRNCSSDFLRTGPFS